MAISITVCGQSNARGQWRNSQDTAHFNPSQKFPLSGMCTSQTMPYDNDGGQGGYAVWPYVSHLLKLRHGIDVMFWNCAVGSTGLLEEWSGATVLRASDVTSFTTNGSTLTTNSGTGLDSFSDGETIRVRYSGAADGDYTVSGSPSAGSLTIAETFAADLTSSNASVHTPCPDFDSGGFDPNDYYSTAETYLNAGTFDARYVLMQFGNRDFNARQTTADVTQCMGEFINYWQGADGILLGGTLLNGTVGGSTLSNGPNFMQNVWKPTCETLVATNSNCYIGAHLGDDVDWDSDGYLKSDNTHFNYAMCFIMAEAWYRAIANMLGYTPSTEGQFDLTFPRPRFA